MKKLLTCATVLLAVAVAHAATVTWNYDLGEFLDDNDEPISGLLSFYDGANLLGTANLTDGWSAYYDDGNSPIVVEDGATVSAVLSMDFGGETGTFTVGSYVFEKPSSVPSWDNVFSDANNMFTQYVIDAPIDSTWTPQDAKDAGWDINVPGGDPVPEPTSVALLALGLAALGLKRKVA